MSKKAATIYNVFMSLFFSLIFTTLGQLLGAGRIIFPGYLISYVLGAVIGFCIVQFLPCALWGEKLAGKFGAKPGSFGFDCCVNLVISLILPTVLTLVMSVFEMSVMGGAPIKVSLLAGLKSIPMYILIAFAAGLVAAKPLQKLAFKAAGEKQRKE